MLSCDVLDPDVRAVLRAQTPFVESDVKRSLLSVGKLTRNGAEMTFSDEGSWVDLHTGGGLR